MIRLNSLKGNHNKTQGNALGNKRTKIPVQSEI